MADTTTARTATWRKEFKRHAAVLPFLGYVSIFLLLPTVIVVIGAFRAPDGSFTLANFAKLAEANTLDAIFTSVWVSLISALVGAVVGALACYALVIGADHNSLVRRLITALSSVLAQFGGVMLAFAFIATIGINGLITQVLAGAFGYTVNPGWLSSLPGLVTIYSYFQIPLMIIVFMPAVTAMRPQWREVNETFGGDAKTYWMWVGGPLLWPSWLGSYLLLFANSFSAFATAAALFSQRSFLVPLMIQGALRNEQDVNQNGFAQVLAFAMVVVVAIVMTLYAQLQKRTARWAS